MPCMPDPIHLCALLNGGWRDLAFQHFRAGVEIFPICTGEPAVALLRYAPGAGVPRHLHTGMETILILDGAQSDEGGRHEAGTLLINPEGSAHSVWSDTGCVVLIQWNRPVRFLPEDTTP
jgi:anti-sigma factor ChrR (cupin superfamily)